ncbi:MAG: ECF transporter S component [Clostridia bacterium]|nr:ECF transporter S component [Clostridia bacterium]
MNKNRTQQVVGIGLFTAIIVVLQAAAISIRFGVFNITLVLIPIVVGAALYGYKAGAWLGFVFGVVVLFTDASVFLAVSIPGTIITVLLKGALAGLISGVIYKLLSGKNMYLAVFAAAIAAPIVNTGIFLLGCRLFFYETISQWAANAGYPSAGKFMILGLCGVNFLVEAAINIVLSPAVLRLINLGKKTIGIKTGSKVQKSMDEAVGETENSETT